MDAQDKALLLNLIVAGSTAVLSPEIIAAIKANQPNRKGIIITNIYTGKVDTYQSIAEAASALNITRAHIRYYLKLKNLYKKGC